MEEKPLFDKPMDELREAFVRARFAQEDVFGAPEIEAWLADQCEAGQPDDGSWSRYRDFVVGACDRRVDIDRILRSCATTVPTGSTVRGASGPISYLLRGELYEGTSGSRAQVIQRADGVNELFVLDATDDKLTVERIGERNHIVGARTVADILFAEWERRWPKMEVAREFLCDALAEEIKRERVKAEVDFDSAVAVSADGTKIVNADWVVVLGQSGTGSNDMAYPASVFQERRILRTGPCGGCQFKVQPWRKAWTKNCTVEQFLAGVSDPDNSWESHDFDYPSMTLHIRTTPAEQSLVCCEDGRVLLTHREQCPDTLPDGGTEVTV